MNVSWIAGVLAIWLVGASAGARAQAAENNSATNGVDTANRLTSAHANDLLQFNDGSSLHGQLRSMNATRGVGWQHPDARHLIEFAPTNIAWIRFEKAKPVTAQGQPSCRLRFFNGDEVFGSLRSIEEETLHLETWFGGALQAPRQGLQSIAFLSKGFSILYEGPTSGEGWVHGKTPRVWEYRDGAFVANGAGTLGRDLKLSGSSSVAFDLAWNGHFSLILALYTPVLDRFDYSSSSYMFYLSPGYVTLQRVQGGAGAMNLGQAQIPEMGRKTKLHVEIRANKEDNTLGLLVDDRLVQRWRDGAGFVGQGSGIVFFAQLDGPSIKVSNMKVAQWEGQLGMDALTNAPTREDLVYLVNRDKVTGKVQQLKNEVLTVAAGGASLDIPISRVNQISMGTTGAHPSTFGPWQLRAFFAGGGTVGFELAQWDHGRVLGKSENFGNVEFDAQCIRQLQFNPARAKASDDGTDLLDEAEWDTE